MPVKRAPDLPPAADRWIAPRTRIDLALATSAMEVTAENWQLTPRPTGEIAAAKAAGKVPCGPCDAWVPAWFGEGCISGICPLRKRAA